MKWALAISIVLNLILAVSAYIFWNLYVTAPYRATVHYNIDPFTPRRFTMVEENKLAILRPQIREALGDNYPSFFMKEINATGSNTTVQISYFFDLEGIYSWIELDGKEHRPYQMNSDNFYPRDFIFDANDRLQQIGR